MIRVGLVGCGALKRPERAPARELYTGELFRRASSYAEEHYDAWWVLSARWGLVHPDTVLAPYNERLSGRRPARLAWGREVARDLELVLCRLYAVVDMDDVELYAHAGREYREPLEAAGLVLVAPLAGLGIGQQLAWYGVRAS